VTDLRRISDVQDVPIPGSVARAMNHLRPLQPGHVLTDLDKSAIRRVIRWVGGGYDDPDERTDRVPEGARPWLGGALGDG
jgi:hypothetical protein